MSTDLVQRARMVFAVDESANGTKLPPATVHMQFSSLCHIIDQIRSGRFWFARKCRFKLKSIHFEVGHTLTVLPHFYFLVPWIIIWFRAIAARRPAWCFWLGTAVFSCAPSFTSGILEGQLHFAFPGKWFYLLGLLGGFRRSFFWSSPLLSCSVSPGDSVIHCSPLTLAGIRKNGFGNDSRQHLFALGMVAEMLVEKLVRHLTNVLQHRHRSPVLFARQFQKRYPGMNIGPVEVGLGRIESETCSHSVDICWYFWPCICLFCTVTFCAGHASNAFRHVSGATGRVDKERNLQIYFHFKFVVTGCLKKSI